METEIDAFEYIKSKLCKCFDLGDFDQANNLFKDKDIMESFIIFNRGHDFVLPYAYNLRRKCLNKWPIFEDDPELPKIIHELLVLSKIACILELSASISVLNETRRLIAV